MLSINLIKRIQSLKLKKNRYKNKLFVAEGAKLISDLISTNLTVKNLFITSTRLTSAFPALNAHADKITMIDEKAMKSISFLQTPSEIFLLAEIPKQATPELSSDGLYLLLDEIRDPGNMGTIIRFADWFGVKAIICSSGCVDVFNPKVVQSSMGSVVHVPALEMSFDELFDKIPKDAVFAADMQGESLYETSLPSKMYLILGNEGKGIQSVESEKLKKIHIPGNGKAESLNVAVAGSIITAFWHSQHRHHNV